MTNVDADAVSKIDGGCQLGNNSSRIGTLPKVVEARQAAIGRLEPPARLPGRHGFLPSTVAAKMSEAPVPCFFQSRMWFGISHILAVFALKEQCDNYARANLDEIADFELIEVARAAEHQNRTFAYCEVVGIVRGAATKLAEFHNFDDTAYNAFPIFGQMPRPTSSLPK